MLVEGKPELGSLIEHDGVPYRVVQYSLDALAYEAMPESDWRQWCASEGVPEARTVAELVREVFGR